MLADAMMRMLAQASMALTQAAEAGEAAAPTASAAAETEVLPPYLPGGSGFMPAEWSTAAAGVDGVYYFITLLSLFFFVLITALTIYFAVKYRRRAHVVPTGGPTHHTPLELTWSIIPLLLVIAIFYVGMKGYVALRTPPIDAYTVNVTAQKWSWSFQHPNGANEVGTLRVPAGRPVRLVMRSEDVLHSLFIPAFRVKQDVVPGRLTELWFESKEPPNGEPVVRMDLVCAEYCGTEHSKMFAQVYVYTEEAFGPAIEKAARWIEDIADEDLWWNAGPRIYARCSSCHSLKDGERKTGPSFRGLFDRVVKGEEQFDDGSTLKALIENGTYTSPEDYIRQSILLPQKHVVETYPRSMPTFQGQLKERHIQAVIEWLRNLDKFDDQGKLIEPR